MEVGSLSLLPIQYIGKMVAFSCKGDIGIKLLECFKFLIPDEAKTFVLDKEEGVYCWMYYR